MSDDRYTPESVAMTINHGFGLLSGPEREAQLRDARQIHEHHIQPLLVSIAKLIQQDQKGSGDDDGTLEDGPLKDTITDMVSRLLYYDRKEDEELPRGEIQRLVKGGWVTHEQIVRWFSDELRAAL